jgi:DnaJ-class molecular chaperone
MIHSAYRVLSDPDARTAYDEQLAREAAVADAELKAELDAQAKPARHAQDVPAALRVVLNQLAA